MNLSDQQRDDRESVKHSYDYCRKIAKSHARNFYYSFIVLPPERKRAMCAVYAFMRYCDDIVDEDTGKSDRKTRLNSCRKALDIAYGETTAKGTDLLPAFADTVRRFEIPRTYFDAIIDGAEMDLTITRYPTFDDLYRYCYRVASRRRTGMYTHLRIPGQGSGKVRGVLRHCVSAYQYTPRHPGRRRNGPGLPAPRGSGSLRVFRGAHTGGCFQQRVQATDGVSRWNAPEAITKQRCRSYRWFNPPAAHVWRP